MVWFNRLARPATFDEPSSDVKLDWSLSTGGTGSVVGYPAKYSFDIRRELQRRHLLHRQSERVGDLAERHCDYQPYVGCPAIRRT